MQYHLDRITFVASFLLALMWATDEMWEQALLAVIALIMLGFRIRSESTRTHLD